MSLKMTHTDHKKYVRFIKQSPDFIKQSPDFIKQSPDFIKQSPDRKGGVIAPVRGVTGYCRAHLIYVIAIISQFPMT